MGVEGKEGGEAGGSSMNEQAWVERLSSTRPAPPLTDMSIENCFDRQRDLCTITEIDLLV